MNARDRHLLIEKHEQNLLTDAEYEQYVDLLQHDADFYEDVRLYQALAQATRQQAHDDLWDMAGQVLADGQTAAPAPQQLWLLVWLRRPIVRRIGLLVLLIAGLGVGKRFYERTLASRTLDARLPVYYLEPNSGQQGMDFGSDDDSANDSLVVLLLASGSDARKLAYTLQRDTLRLYMVTPSRSIIANWRLTYNPVAERYQLLRQGRKPIPLQSATTQPLPLP